MKTISTLVAMTLVAASLYAGGALADQPCFVHHVNDPAGAPVEEWLTEIYLPFEHSATATADAGSESRVS